MDQLATSAAPYFSPDLLRAELDSLAAEHKGGALRTALLDQLKELVEQSRSSALQRLEADGAGRTCATGLSQFQDALIRLTSDFVTQHLYPVVNRSSAERMAIVATGGYGRGLLAPASDIDLLFLLPYKQTAWGESVAEYLLYLLWDLGFKVGHATRSVDQCIRLSQTDFTIRTALLDARLILGEEPLFVELKRRFRNDIVDGTGREFIASKLEERDLRHARSGASRYLVEPNIKDGKGGLRDLHTLYWLAKYLKPDAPNEDFVAAGVFTRAEQSTFRRCGDFLWTVRCHLHFLTGRAEERLSFDVQPSMAERLGYKPHAGLSAVERFMKHYFLVAKDVGDLTRVLCSELEIRQLKPPRFNQLMALNWRRRARLRHISDFRIENGRINAARQDIFDADPVNFIRLFTVAEQYHVSFQPEVLRLLRSRLPAIGDQLRDDPAANRLFLRLLTASSDPEIALRKMNETGVLGRFIPDFGRIVSMMQFNMYHHYTVDEHLIRTVGVLAGIDQGRYALEHPVSTEIIKTIDNRRALYVATLLHDIAKGRREDHSPVGARIARELGPRLQLTPAETETAAWLIEHHLVMSQTAQSRDLNDPKTIRDFADLVQSRERLKLLMLLTVADIRAVGPGVWNGWKGQLLRTLYFETEPLLGGGHSPLTQSQRTKQARALLRERLEDWPQDQFDRYAARHYSSYWLRTDADTQATQARLIWDAEKNRKALVTHVATDAFQGVTSITLFAPNHPRLLSMAAGACAGAGANIMDAQISTTRDGMALDTIHLEREFDRSEDEERRAGRIASTLTRLLNGEVKLTEVVAGKRRPKARLAAFRVTPQIAIDNTMSDELTVIEIAGLDRPGLLYDLTREISDANLDIASAHIATFGEKAVDVFYVTDLTGKKVVSAARHAAIRHRLARVLEDRIDENGAKRYG